MLADMHRQAALDNEQAATLLGDPATRSFVRRAIIELYWGASFHWIAYGCQRKHGKHKENHTKLVSYLRDQGEDAMAAWRPRGTPLIASASAGGTARMSSWMMSRTRAVSGRIFAHGRRTERGAHGCATNRG